MSPPQDASENLPAPPPEAVLIRLVREAAGIKTPDAARRARISKARWSQVELGYEKRLGTARPVRASASTLAHMASVLPLSPERLESEGGRPDAAVVLREMQRHPGPVAEVFARRDADGEPPLRYSDPALQHVADTPGPLSNQDREVLVEMARILMKRRKANDHQRPA